MNERLKELVNTYADVIAVQNPAGVYEIKYESGQTGIEFTEDSLVEFAKLIINECADIATINQFQQRPTGEYIKDHFYYGTDRKVHRDAI
jgi:hypothetical protein